MKVPYLPLSIDSFGGPATRVSAHSPLYLLSHFHTDHMKGLSGSWCGGVIICTEVTKALVLQRFGQELEERIVALPLWQRTVLLESVSTVLGRTHLEAVTTESVPSAAGTVLVTLLPAFHIPGSVMFYLETPCGNLLYTGDFKFEEGTFAPTVLGAFFSTHRVDHVYIDDTWLHLGVEVRTDERYTQQERTTLVGVHGQRAVQAVSGSSAAQHTHDHNRVHRQPHSQVGGEESAGEADAGSDDDDLFRIFDSPDAVAPAPAALASSPPVAGPSSASPAASGARVLSKLLNRQQTAEAIEAIGRRMDYQRQQFIRARCPPQTHAATAFCGAQQSPPSPQRIFPFKIRVYLHNQFGKELLIQQLAARLGTRALIDDERYARLALVAAQLANPVRCATASELSSDAGDDVAMRMWDSQGGERSLYPLDMDRFVSYSQYKAILEAFDAESNGVRLSPDDVVRLRLPLVEVVSSRAKISDAALEEATMATGGAPFYGVVISGWARLQRRRGAPERVWQVPTTLHCAPDETIRFVSLLRPLSITPLHYRPSRAAVVLQRLGPLLRTPFVNSYLQTSAGLTTVTGSGATSWVTPLAPHTEGIDRLSIQQADDVFPGKRRGFRLRESAGDAAAAVPSDTAGRERTQHVVPDWKVDALVDTLLVRRKRVREAQQSPGLSLESLADMVDASTHDSGSREPSWPANTIIL